MPAVWTYPWNLHLEGVTHACRDLANRGIDAINVASHYHSVRSMHPRFPEELFRSYPGGCYFVPDSERFAQTPIEPSMNRVTDEDPLASIVTAARNTGLAVNAWVVCLHNSRLGTENPEYRIESVFGDAHDHSLCPSHPEVRDYFAAVIDSVVRRGVDEVQLETIGYPSAFHGHGWQFGHDKHQLEVTRSEDVLISQCFCDGCRAAATDTSLDFDAARECVQRLVRYSLRESQSTLPDVATLLQEYPELQRLFEFRADVITNFVRTLAAAADQVPLNYYVGLDTSSHRPVGVRLTQLESLLDRMTVICYTRDPAVARGRIRTVRRRVGCPIDAGITLDPDVIERKEQFISIVHAIQAEPIDQLSVYHHGLATEKHLNWMEEAFAEL